MSNKIWIVVGAVLGLVAVFLINDYIHRLEVKIRRELLHGREPTSVLIATQDVPEQTVIDDTMVAVDTKPADAIQPHSLVNPGEAIGKVAVVPIYQGEQILDSKLSRPEHADTLSMKTPPGKRAVTIGIDNISGVGGFIHPGDYVDMLGIFSLPTPDAKQAVVTVTLLQRVLVLATGKQFSELVTKQVHEGRDMGSITLALSPEETELVLFARAQGQLQLSLRPKTDSLVVHDLQPMTLEALVGLILGPQVAQQAQKKKEPSPPPPPTRQVEVFRGLKKEVVVLPAEEPQE